LITYIFEAVYHATQWYIDKGTCDGDIALLLGLYLDLSLQHVKGLLYIGMCMRAGSAAGRDDHLYHAIGAACLRA
jgi:hypothetical protein